MGQAYRTVFQPSATRKENMVCIYLLIFFCLIYKFWILDTFLDIFNYVSNIFALSIFSKFKITIVPGVRLVQCTEEDKGHMPGSRKNVSEMLDVNPQVRA